MEDTTSEWFVATALMALADRRAEAAQGETAAPETAPDAQVRDADPFATRLWNLLRIRRALTADEAAALLLTDAQADEDIALGRRQAGALMLSWSRQCPQAVRMNARRVDGMKRYTLLRDIGATPPAPRGRPDDRNAAPYMQEAWFALLRQACDGRSRSKVAAQLHISPAAVSQVLNASGKYGAGKARTDRIARRVLDTFGEPATNEETAA